MKVKEVMAHFPKDGIHEDFNGPLTNNDFVLAIGLTSQQSVAEFMVVQDYIEGVNPALSSESVTKTYLRTGKSSLKVSTQRTFSVTGDRLVGDDFQDFVFSNLIKFGTGSTVVRPYVFYNLKNGKGEKGMITISVNSDGSGNAEDNAAIDIKLEATHKAPEDFDITTEPGVWSA